MGSTFHCLFAVLLAVSAGLVSVMSGYLLFLSVMAIFNSRRKPAETSSHHRDQPASFVVLIPAFNEELLIGDTVHKLSSVNYPTDRYDVVVIADNCSDATAQRARESGATVLEREDKDNRGKGQALDWAMQEHLSGWADDFDAVVVMDADSHLNTEFLWAMNEEFQQGHELLQGYYTVSNPEDSWRTSLLTASLGLVHYLRPLARDTLGFSCGLKGNGFAISRRLVQQYGYPASSNVEDVELSLFYMMKNIRAQFVPNARVYGQMTSDPKAAAQQRTRWEGGRVRMILDWVPRLLKKGVFHHNMACLDTVAELLIPPFALLAFGTGLLFVLAVIGTTFIPGIIPLLSMGLTAGSLACQIVYVFTGLILIRASALIWRRMLFGPLYVGWKMLLYLKMIIQPSETQKWKRTNRHKRND